MNVASRGVSLIALFLCLLALLWGHSAESASVRRTRAYRRPPSQRGPKKTAQKIIIYTYGLTIAEVARNPLDGTLQYCKLTELKSGSQCEATLASLNRPVRQFCAKKMMTLIDECVGLEHEEEVSDGRNVGDDTGFLAGLFSGIFPGTKWCGTGNKANNYFDLGSRGALDKCCRAHDHCPIKVEKWSHAYGEMNWSFYTKSHCDCDVDFFNCLMAVDSAAADTVGDLYFNQMKVPCLREPLGTSLCPAAKSSNDRCPTASLHESVTLISHDPEFLFVGKNRTKLRDENDRDALAALPTTSERSSSFRW